MSLPQRGTIKRKAPQVHVKAPTSPVLSFPNPSAIVRPTAAALSALPPSSDAVASSSTPSAHKRRLIVDSDDEGQSDTVPSANTFDPHTQHFDNLDEINLINRVLDSHPMRSMSPTVHADQESHAAAPTAAPPAAAVAEPGTAVAEPGAAVVRADQDQEQDTGFNSFPASMTIRLLFRRGEPLGKLRSIRDWPSPTFVLRRSDSYRVLLALIQQHIEELKAMKLENGSLVWPEPTPYVQPTNSSKQQHYRPIDAENYDVVLAGAWHAERRRLGAEADIQVRIYVYLKDGSVKSASSLQRAAQAQPRAVEANNHLEGDGGDIPHARLYHELRQIHVALAVLAGRIASGPAVQPEDGGQSAVPQSAPYRRAGHPDGERTGARAGQGTGVVPQEQHGIIRIMLFNDQWVPVMMDIGDMRRALGLAPVDRTVLGDRQQDHPPTRAPPGSSQVIDLDDEETPH
ncbi:hypothetical protein BGZ72_000185, partial [Mortierella alpina]